MFNLTQPFAVSGKGAQLKLCRRQVPDGSGPWQDLLTTKQKIHVAIGFRRGSQFWYKRYRSGVPAAATRISVCVTCPAPRPPRAVGNHPEVRSHLCWKREGCRRVLSWPQVLWASTPGQGGGPAPSVLTLHPFTSITASPSGPSLDHGATSIRQAPSLRQSCTEALQGPPTPHAQHVTCRSPSWCGAHPSGGRCICGPGGSLHALCRGISTLTISTVPGSTCLLQCTQCPRVDCVDTSRVCVRIFFLFFSFF